MKLLKPILRPFQTRLISHLLNNFSYWQSRGVHVVPVHFYQPIPDTRTLKPELWSRVADLPGLNLNDDHQFQLLDSFVSNYSREYEALPREKTEESYRYFINNGAFESVDGEVLYCMVRHFRPRRIFEIGSGNSTYLSAQAALKNIEDGAPCDLTAFEPYPNHVLQQGFPGLTALMRVQAQDIPLEKFAELERNDILFIDSSHVLKIGSDVQYLYLEVLPRLRPGVVIHIHDIFLPAEYPQHWVMQQQTFWNEQYLLQAFLTFNDSFEVHWAGSYMHLKHPERLEAAFSSYDRRTRWPGSFWMSRKF